MTGNSLGFRLAAGAVLWITAALVVAGFVLSGLFRDHVEQSFERELVVQLDRLAAVSRVGPKGTLELKRVIVDPRFFDAYSGWYWQIAGPDGPIFRSRSLWDQALAVDRGTLPADTIERYATTGPNDQTLWGLRRNITLPGSQTVYQITVAADVAETRAAIEGFNTTLALSLVVLGVGLFAAVVIQVRYGLSPMRRLRRALADVRAGSTARLVGRFPDEVTPLADELNALLDHNAAVVERARTHTGNLAHALKTPLSVIANAAAEGDGALADTVRQQAARMGGLVDHHLARARTAAASVIGARTDARAVGEELRRTLARLYPDRDIVIVGDDAAEAVFLGEHQDLQEMLGNLMDNACKWSRETVRVTLARRGQRLELSVEDDGPGLAPDARARVFDRGSRLDEAVPGDGLGLGIVRDVAELYGGSVSLADSTLGGLSATLDLPAA